MDVHVCDVPTLDYQYTTLSNGYRFCYRIVCTECGRRWDARMYPDRHDILQKGHKIVLWFCNRPGPKPDFCDRYKLSVLTAVPWNYFDEDYGTEVEASPVKRHVKVLKTEALEMADAWREFRESGGFHQWP